MHGYRSNDACRPTRAQVKALTLEDCLATFDRCVARGAPERRPLLARVYGSQHRPLMEAETQRTISEAAAAGGGGAGALSGRVA
eukprot:COSAG01_NODE_9357_length_2470_cov_675.651202_5_plen_84_part_00